MSTMGREAMLRYRLLILVFAFSFGLSLASFSPAAASETEQTCSLFFGGQERTYILHLPPGHDRSVPVPLVIALHGGGGNGGKMVRLTQGGFDRLADKEGFAVVYPDGIGRNWNDGRSGAETGYDTHLEGTDDVGFISALIDSLIKELNIDPKRVYVTGMSNGGMMTYRIGCALAGKVAAIAPVTGNIPKNLSPSCSPDRPISVLAINNVNDPLMPFEGGDVTGPFGRKKLGKVLSARDSVGFWARHNQCSFPPDLTYALDPDPGDGTRIREEAYRGCRDNTEVLLYAVEGGGHTWPCGLQYLKPRLVGKTSRDMDANQVIWEFFRRHQSQ